MSANFHTSYVDATTLVNATQMEAVIGSFDELLGKGWSRCFAMARAPLTENGTTVKYPAIDVFYHRPSDGKFIKNTIAATTLILPNGQAGVITLNDTEGGAVTISAQDIDTLPTALTDKNKVVLFARSKMASGTGLLHYVALQAPLHLVGTSSLAAATTTTVNFPTGFTLPSGEYQIRFTPTAAGFWARDPYVSTKNAGSFVLTHTNTAGAQTFDYQVVPN